MSNPDHLKIIEQGVGAWNKWRRSQGLGEVDHGPPRRWVAFRPDLSGADLHGRDLDAAALYNANLSGADLTKRGKAP